MPPKKDETKGQAESAITGFEPKETKLLAAGFLSMIGADKYDYDVMATLTGNTAGSLKKMFPPVKRKAIELHPSFATFLNAGAATTAATAATGEEKKAAPKAAGKKRKATSEPETDAAAEDQPDGKKTKENGKKKAPAKPRAPRKKAKVEREDLRKEPTPDGAASGDGQDTDVKAENEEEV